MRRLKTISIMMAWFILMLRAQTSAPAPPISATAKPPVLTDAQRANLMRLERDQLRLQNQLIQTPLYQQLQAVGKETNDYGATITPPGWRLVECGTQPAAGVQECNDKPQGDIEFTSIAPAQPQPAPAPKPKEAPAKK